MQTDPIGYGDGMNMYAYVGGDPVNSTDPTGQFGVPIGNLLTTGVQNCHRVSTTCREFRQGSLDTALGYAALTRFLVNPNSQRSRFIRNVFRAAYNFAANNPVQAANIALDRYSDRGLAYNTGAFFTGAVVSATIIAATRAGRSRVASAAIRVGNFAVVLTGTQLRAASRAFDRLQSAGVPASALSSSTLAGIGLTALSRASYSYDSSTNTLTATITTSRPGSRIPNIIRVDIPVEIEEDELEESGA